MSDEEIQKMFESGSDDKLSGADNVSYRAVFRALSKSPTTRISTSFADRIVSKIIAQKKREARRDIIWLGFGVVFLLVGLIVTAAVAGLAFDLGFLKEMSGYTGILVFGIAMVILFNWLEKKTISKAIKL